MARGSVQQRNLKGCLEVLRSRTGQHLLEFRGVIVGCVSLELSWLFIRFLGLA